MSEQRTRRDRTGERFLNRKKQALLAELPPGQSPTEAQLAAIEHIAALNLANHRYTQKIKTAKLTPQELNLAREAITEERHHRERLERLTAPSSDIFR